MTFQDLGSIGELVGAVAVVISLLYPALQIQQNTRAVRIATYQAIMESSNRIGVLNLYEALFLQHQQGAIDDDFFQGRLATFHRMIHQPGLRHMWNEGARTYYARSFVRRVDELLATPPDETEPPITRRCS